MKTKSEIQMKSFNVRRFFIYTHVSYLQLLIWIQITYSLMKSLIMSKLVDKEYLRNMNFKCVHNMIFLHNIKCHWGQDITLSGIPPKNVIIQDVHWYNYDVLVFLVILISSKKTLLLVYIDKSVFVPLLCIFWHWFSIEKCLWVLL